MWKIGQNVRITFTDKKLEDWQSLDCQIAGIQRNGRHETLLFNIPRVILFFEDGDELRLHEWGLILDTPSVGVILALASQKIGGPQYTVEWKATVEPLSDREDTGGF